MPSLNGSHSCPLQEGGERCALWQLFHPGASLVSEAWACAFWPRAVLTKVLQLEFFPIVKNRVTIRVEQRRKQSFPHGVVFQEEAWGHLIPPPEGSCPVGMCGRKRCGAWRAFGCRMTTSGGRERQVQALAPSYGLPPPPFSPPWPLVRPALTGSMIGRAHSELQSQTGVGFRGR